MSALLPKADIVGRNGDVRFVPKAEVAVIRSVELIVQPPSPQVKFRTQSLFGLALAFSAAVTILFPPGTYNSAALGNPLPISGTNGLGII